MIFPPRRSRRRHAPRQKFAGIVAVIAALVASMMPALSRTLRGYPRGSVSLSQAELFAVVLIPIVVLGAVALIRFSRRSEEVHHGDAGASGDVDDSGDAGDPGGSDDERQDELRRRKMIVLAIVIALVTLAFGATYYITAAGPR